MKFLLCLFSLLLSPVHFSQVAADAHLSSSSFNAALQTLQKQIGYDFKAVDLLRRAMTHSSYSGENCRALALLGLHAIDASAALRLLLSDVDASAAAVDGRIDDASGVASCAAAGARLGLEKIVRVSKPTDASAPAVVCAAFRAIFGAVAVDSGSVDAAGAVFVRLRGGGIAGF